MVSLTGPYLGFFVCGGKLGFREISDQYSYKKQPSKIRHYVRKKTFSFPGGGNCPLRPPLCTALPQGPVLGPNLFTSMKQPVSVYIVTLVYMLTILSEVHSSPKHIDRAEEYINGDLKSTSSWLTSNA